MARLTLLVVWTSAVLAGCVTVVVPTAAAPSPVSYAGHAEGTGLHTDAHSDLFALAAGDYAVTWDAQPAGCFFNLVFTSADFTDARQLVPPVVDPAPLGGVGAGTYRWVVNTDCASWTTSLQRQ